MQNSKSKNRTVSVIIAGVAGFLPTTEMLAVWRNTVPVDGRLLHDNAIIGVLAVAFPGERHKLDIPEQHLLEGPVTIGKVVVTRLPAGHIVFSRRALQYGALEETQFAPFAVAEDIKEPHAERIARVAAWANVRWMSVHIRNQMYRDMPLGAFHRAFSEEDVQWREAVAARVQQEEEARRRISEIQERARVARERPRQVRVVDRRHPLLARQRPVFFAPSTVVPKATNPLLTAFLARMGKPPVPVRPVPQVHMPKPVHHETRAPKGLKSFESLQLA